MSEVSEVSAEQWRVWRSFYAMRRQLDRALENQLQTDSAISSADYEILLAIFESTEKRLRSRDLAERIGWEKSRISHQVSRMTARGLLNRTECEDDLRGTWVEITAEGRRATLGAMRGHTRAIREFFFDVLDERELAALLSVSDKVLAAVAPAPCDPA
ncbi:MarR family winged helix-turn-helix transcriptional regulator [Homoserinimonas aerilata]|nr:MarR family winged helix-turn-helix transcriptional regulator [Homoserinimonas aerilata]